MQLSKNKDSERTLYTPGQSKPQTNYYDCTQEKYENNSNIILYIILVIEETLLMKVIGEPVLKLNTGILPSSMEHQFQIVYFKFGNNYIYPTETWAKGIWCH